MKHLSKYMLAGVCALVLVGQDVSAQESALPPEVAESQAAHDAVGGTVDEDASWQKVYDFYSRQLAYREKTKAFDESMKKRQESFAGPSAELVEAYKENLKAVYENEAEIEKKREEKGAEEEVHAKVSDMKEVKAPISDKAEKTASAEDAGEPIQLKEIDIPPSPEQEEDIKRKVVTENDAPEFDPSEL